MRKEMYYGAEPILFEFAKEMRNHLTEAEAYLWRFLSEGYFDYHFRRQHPIKYFIADFYCHAFKLVIEVDGGYHGIPEQYEYDCERDWELSLLGITVLRFTNEEVLYDIEHVLQIINNKLQ